MRRLALALAVMGWALMGVSTGYLPGGGLTPEVITVADATDAIIMHTYPSIDDEPGVADGEGADPFPHPGSQVAKIRLFSVLSGAAVAPNNLVNTLMRLWSYNTPDPSVGGIFENPNLPSSGWSCEFSYEPTAASRSGAPQHECYWQINPQSHVVTFAGGGSGTATLADQLVFTNGARCRVMDPSTAVNGGMVRMSCLNRVPPAVGNTITSCEVGGTCTGPPSGTVAAVVADRDWRPFFYELFLDAQTVNWKQVKGLVKGSATEWQYWLVANPTNNRLSLGRASFDDPNASTVNIPDRNCFNNDAHNQGASQNGDLCIDQSDDGGAGGYYLFVADNDVAYGLHPTTTQCFEHSDLDATDDDRVIPITAYQRVKLVAFGCGNNTTAAGGVTTAAQLSIEDGAGNAITTSATLTCAGSDQSVAWVTIDPATDTDAVLTSGERLRFDTTNTPNPATDEHTICVAYQYWRV